MKITIIFVLVAVVLTGCRSEVPIDDLELVEPKLSDEHFRVTMQVIVPKDDSFALYYTFGGTDFSQQQPLWTPVSGNPEAQKVQFVFPQEVKPRQLRIDFGMNKTQADIVLKRITMTYNDKEFSVSGQDIFRYFRADDGKCTLNPDNGTLKGKVVDGVKQGPSLYPMENALGAEIEKLIK